jgi:hypothetical protein
MMIEGAAMCVVVQTRWAAALYLLSFAPRSPAKVVAYLHHGDSKDGTVHRTKRDAENDPNEQHDRIK